MTDTMIFDFDGTVAVGDGPIRAYAEALAQLIPAAAAEEFCRQVGEDLQQFAAGDGRDDILDGYDLVRRHAVAVGLTPTEIDTAYRVSRALLATPQASVAVPRGLVAFLRGVADSGRPVRTVLVTNAPDIRLAEALQVLGVSELFAEVHSSARKPDGLTRLAAVWQAQGRTLGVGDIWRNDLQPLAQLGGDTALIGEPGEGERPTFHAPTMTELLPHLEGWVQQSTAGTARRPPVL